MPGSGREKGVYSGGDTSQLIIIQRLRMGKGSGLTLSVEVVMVQCGGEGSDVRALVLNHGENAPMPFKVL